MIDYLVYETATGKILRSGSCPIDMVSMQALENESSLADVTCNDIKQYIINDIVTDKQIMGAVIDTTNILADGVEKSTITLMEANSEVFIDEISQGINVDTILELTFDTIGSYVIRIDLFPYLDKEFTVNAN